MIKQLSFKNFVSHKDLRLNKLGSVNLILGKNDTGKTAILKMMYASLSAIVLYNQRKANEEISLKKVLSEKLLSTFQPGKKGLGELVNKLEKDKLRVDLEFEHQNFSFKDRLYFSYGESTVNSIIDCQESIGKPDPSFRPIFIPAKEVLTSLKAIRATRDNLNIPGFDDTYLDLIRSLVIPTQKGKVKSELVKVNDLLEGLFEGNIVQSSDDDFIFKKGNTEYQIALTAEGVKKIGILTTLIRNRQLTPNAVLFMDEPENALHPEAVRVLVDMIFLMAKSGMQIFLATHSYFVLKQVYLSAIQNEMDAFCFLLKKEIDKTVSATSHNLRAYFPENEISEEAIKMADLEAEMDFNLK